MHDTWVQPFEVVNASASPGLHQWVQKPFCMPCKRRLSQPRHQIRSCSCCSVPSFCSGLLGRSVNMRAVRLCLVLLASFLLHQAHAIAPFGSWQKRGAIKARPSYTPEAEADRVDDLPGSPNGLDFNMFSG
jgi:hypothetical protein